MQQGWVESRCISEAAGERVSGTAVLCAPSGLGGALSNGHYSPISFRCNCLTGQPFRKVPAITSSSIDQVDAFLLAENFTPGAAQLAGAYADH